MAITVEELQILISAEVAEALKGLKSVQKVVAEINEAAAAPARAVSAAAKQATEQATAPIRQQQEAMKQAADFQAQTAKDINDAIKRSFEQQKAVRQAQTDAITEAAQAPAKAVGEITKAQQEAWAQYREGQAGAFDIDTDPSKLQVQKDIDAAIGKLNARVRAERELREAITQRAIADANAARPHMTDKQRWIVDNPDKKVSEYVPPVASPAPSSAWNQALQQYYAKLDFLKQKLHEVGLYGVEQVKAVSQVTQQATAQTKKYANAYAGANKKVADTVNLHKKSLGYLAASARRAVVMSVLYGALRTITGGITEGLKNIAQASQQANATMSNLSTGALYLKNSIGSALLPILQALTPVITFLTEKISTMFQMVGMLSARIFNNATTFIQAKKAAVDYAQSVKGAQNQLAGFDELNVLTQQNPGMPNPKDMFEEVAIPEETLAMADRIKAIFKGIAEVVAAVTAPIREMFSKLWEYYKANEDNIKASLANVWETIKANKDNILAVLVGLTAGFAAFKIGSFISELGGVVGILGKVKLAFSALNLPVLAISAAIAVVVAEFVHLYQTSDEFRAKVNDAITKTKDIFIDIWQKWIEPVFNQIKDTISRLWTDTVQPTIDNVLNKFFDIYNEAIAPLLSWLVDLLAPVVQWVFDGVLAVVEFTVTNFCWWINLCIDGLSGLITFLTGVFTGDWSLAWDGVKEIFATVWNGIADVVEGICNFMIKCINFVIKGINSMLNIDLSDAPKMIRDKFGDSWGINIPLVPELDIPRYAKGAVVTQPTLAWTGEYAGASSNPEIVAPQSIMRETVVEANAPMVTAMYEMATMIVQAIEDNAVVPVENPDAMYRWVLKKEGDFRKRTGRAGLNYGY